jgi:hypothetical protein
MPALPCLIPAYAAFGSPRLPDLEAWEPSLRRLVRFSSATCLLAATHQPARLANLLGRLAALLTSTKLLARRASALRLARAIRHSPLVSQLSHSALTHDSLSKHAFASGPR